MLQLLYCLGKSALKTVFGLICREGSDGVGDRCGQTVKIEEKNRSEVIFGCKYIQVYVV